MMIELVNELEAKMVDLAKAAGEHVANEIDHIVVNKLGMLSQQLNAIQWMVNTFHSAQNAVHLLAEVPQTLAEVAKQ